MNLGSGCWILWGRLPDIRRPSEKELCELWTARPVVRESYLMYGKPVAVPRFMTLYAEGPLSVRVSGKDFEAETLCSTSPRFLQRLLSSAPASLEYNTVLANWYNSGDDYIGWHGDREKQIDPEAPIISVSLGAPRRFQVRHEASGKTIFDEMLSDGDCVVMGGPGFQQTFKHRVPKMIAKKDGEVGARINLTVRKYRAHVNSGSAPPPAAKRREERVSDAEQPSSKSYKLT